MASAESGRYNNTVAFDYDAAGRLTSESLTVTYGQTTTYTVQSAYDAANRRTGITYPDGSVVARQYTARDQLAQIDYNSAMVATFAYDPASRRTSRTLGDTPGTQTAWTYGRQDNLPTAMNSGVAGASFTYTYDANKNKLTEGISAPMANFGFNSTAYDPADRLTAWNRTDGNLDQAWNLSLVGDWATFTENQLQQTRSHTSVHEIAAIDSASIAHDPAGNLTRNAGDTLDRFTWDFDNRLASADVAQDGTAECGYQYDALGRRVSKTVPDGETSSTTVFVGTIQALEYSPHAMQVVAEYAADAVPASPERKFVYAEYIDEPVLMVRLDGPAETHYYYHQNSLFSVAAITDAMGTVVERYAYSAYGKPIFLDANANLLDPQASTIGNPYLFTGRRLDEETGLYYYRARMYDAELGRFVGRDPTGYGAQDLNLYRYVANHPLHAVDPDGRDEASLSNTPRVICTRDEYWDKWKKQHPGLTDEQYQWAEKQLDRGCVGITCMNLGTKPSYDNCFSTLDEAEEAKCNKRCSAGSEARIFSVHFWDEKNEYKPDPKTKKVDLTPWLNKDRKDWHRPRPGGGRGTNFDYNKYGRCLHANHSHRPPSKPMEVYSSTLAKWQQESYWDFNQEVWCVECDDGKVGS